MTPEGGARALHALSFDIEEFFHSSNLTGAITPQDWPNLPSRVEPRTYWLLDLLASTNQHATFFVLGWVAERHPQLISAIGRGGHEIASHGYGHLPVYRQTPGEFREDIRRAKRVLEDLHATSVVGYRAPTYSIVRGSLWALDVLVDEGYRYDSSIFPVYHDRYGIPAAPRHPFRFRNGLVEFPLSTWQGPGIRLPIGGGGYFRLFPYALMRGAFRALERENLPGIFYLHPWDLDSDQPLAGVSPLQRWRQTVGSARAPRKLERFLREFRFAPVGTVLAGLPLRECGLCE